MSSVGKSRDNGPSTKAMARRTGTSHCVVARAWRAKRAVVASAPVPAPDNDDDVEAQGGESVSSAVKHTHCIINRTKHTTADKYPAQENT